MHKFSDIKFRCKMCGIVYDNCPPCPKCAALPSEMIEPREVVPGVLDDGNRCAEPATSAEGSGE
jgi:hypothetical protein